MKQLMSYYVMDDDTDEKIREMTDNLGLDGIESLVYGTKSRDLPGKESTIGCHLNYWPDWMNFWLGKRELFEEEFPTRDSLISYYGGETPEEWLETIRGNLRAAAREEPKYVVWHVADCMAREAWTGKFHYTDKEVLFETARIYSLVKNALPSNVTVLLGNIFWPGLNALSPENVDYFFSLLGGGNVGLLLDTGHLMNTNPDIRDEKDGADYVTKVIKNLGSMKDLILGMHLSCSISGEYRKRAAGNIPAEITPEVISRHISSIDRHEPFRTEAAARIVEAAEPSYVTHELFGKGPGIPEEEIKIQMNAMKKGYNSCNRFSLFVAYREK